MRVEFESQRWGMMKSVLVLILLLAISSVETSAQSTPAYVLVSVEECSPDQLAELRSFDPHGVSRSARGLSAVLRSDDLARLDRLGCPYEILIPDLTDYYRDRAAAEEKDRGEQPTSAADENVDPTHFRLGPVAGSYTLEEFAAITDSMALLYPDLIDVATIGWSVQGRPIRMFTITAPGGSSGRPRALFTGLHHAREPLSMVNLVYTMWFLLENYGVEDRITALLEGRILHFVPVVNPDGYQKNLDDAPQGGGMWRKNMGGGYGVDLNRNYGPTSNWSNPAEGASNDPTSDNYRGPTPFSEPEIAALRDLYDSIRVAVSLHHHSFGDVLLYGHDDHYDYPSGGSWRVRSAARLSQQTGCGFGPNFLGIGYLSSGTATAYARDVAPDAGFAWTAESGKEDDGFWPLPSRYLPLCRDYLPMNLELARMAGSYVVVDDAFLDQEGRLTVVVRNVGTAPSDVETSITIGPHAVVAGPLLPDQTSSVVIPIDLSRDLLSDARSDVPVTLETGPFRDTVRVDLLGYDRVQLFRDDFEGNMSRWDAGLWGIETAASAGRVLGDSPYEQTLFSRTENVCLLRDVVDLGMIEAADILFRARGTLQGIHYGFRIMARRPGSPEWRSLQGDLFQRENSMESLERTVMRGDHDVWRRYRVGLDEFVGGPVELRLIVSTNARMQVEMSDGVQIDDFTVVGARSISGVPGVAARDEQSGPRAIIFDDAAGVRQVREALGPDDPPRTVSIVELSGRSVGLTTSIDETIHLLELLPSGVYFLHTSGDGRPPVQLLKP